MYHFMNIWEDVARFHERNIRESYIKCNIHVKRNVFQYYINNVEINAHTKFRLNLASLI